MLFFKWGCFLLLISLAVVASIMKSSADFSAPIYSLERLIGGDKVLHFSAATVLGFFSVWCTPERLRFWLPNGLGWPTVILSILVLADEVSQIWLPRRQFSWLDLLADFTGLLSGFIAYIVIFTLLSAMNRIFLLRN